MAILGKSSFFRSTMEGIKGYVKGAIAGGLTGIVAGAAVGAIVGIFLPMGSIAAAGVGAMWVGSALAGLGSFSGMATGVVQSREGAKINAQDVINVANISFAQGVSSAQQLAQAEEKSQPSTRWRDREAQRRQVAMQQSQQIH